MYKVSLRLEAIRQSKGYSLRRLSKLSGVSKSHINYIENGVKSPTLRTLTLLGNALHCRVEDLITYTDR